MRFERSLIDGEIECAREAGGRWPPTTSVRHGLRSITDEVIHKALRNDSMAELAEGMCLIMLTSAKTTVAYNLDPDVADFVEACTALIEDARSVADRGLTTHDERTAKCGLVMLELTVRGIAAALGMPYEDLVRAVHAGDDVRPILREAGLLKPESEQSDEQQEG